MGKRIGAVLLGLTVVLATAAAWFVWQAERQLGRHWEITPAEAQIDRSAANLIEGARLAQIGGCTECHGADLGGKVLAQAPIGDLIPPNLTRGRGSVTRDYQDVDWQRALRHGVGPGGRPLLLMPSDDSTAMSSADFASLVAYLESVPPVDRELAPTRLSVLGKLLMGAGQLPLLTVERIDHSLPPATPTIAVSVEFGGYVARVCTGCHRANLAGGAIPGMPPEFPPAANLTASSRVHDWTLEQLATAVRTGQRPDGSAIAAAHMPWPAFAAMTDTEIAALHAYLQQLPAVPATN